MVQRVRGYNLHHPWGRTALSHERGSRERPSRKRGFERHLRSRINPIEQFSADGLSNGFELLQPAASSQQLRHFKLGVLGFVRWIFGSSRESSLKYHAEIP